MPVPETGSGVADDERIVSLGLLTLTLESTSRRHGDSPRKVGLNQTSEQMFV